jgi:hypothetical protein
MLESIGIVITLILINCLAGLHKNDEYENQMIKDLKIIK